MRSVLVILDNGHGVETQGKRSRRFDDGTQLLEWEYTREITKRIQNFLNNTENIKCVRIVEENKDIPLSERAKRANKLYKEHGKSTLLVSVHCNASQIPNTATGWEVWSTVGKTNSDKLANSFIRVFDTIFPDKKMRGHKEKNFTILYATDCPCVMTENFFMNNDEEAKWMLTEDAKENISNLHINAITDYITNILGIDIIPKIDEN